MPEYKNLTMTDSNDYRLYLEKCFDAVNERFDAINKRLDDILEQTTKTNSRVNHAEDKINGRQKDVDDFRHLEKEFGSVRDKVDKIDRDLLEIWFFKKYPKVFFGILAVAVAAILGLSINNNQKVKDIKQKVNYIEAYEKIPNAPTRGAIEAYQQIDTVK